MNATLARILRSFRRSPGFVAIATLSLGCALGLSTAVFALMDAMTHPEPPFRDVDQLARLNIGIDAAIVPSREELRAGISSLSAVEAMASAGGDWRTVVAGERADRAAIALARPGYFELLGVRPRLGRLPAPDEQGAERVAVVSDRMWRRNFANRRTIGDATITVGDRHYVVVGVLPRGTSQAIYTDVWLPDPTPEGGPVGQVYVRLRPGVTIAQFQPQLKELFDRYTKIYAGPRKRGFRAWIGEMRPDPLQIRDVHRALIGGAICVLVIACANIAALMLARGMVRRRDYALRLALGARPGEIAREVLGEISVLAVIGCVAGAIGATWVVGLITGATPEEWNWEGFAQPQWSWRVLALSALAVFASVAVAGGYPAWRAARTDPAGPLKEGSGGNTGRSGTRFRWLVMAELALSMTLLMGTSLMFKSVGLMSAYDFGYDSRHIVRATAFYYLRDSVAKQEWMTKLQIASDAVRALPNVRSMSVSPSTGCQIVRSTILSDRSVEGGVSLRADRDGWQAPMCTSVGPDFFATIGLPIVDGRDFAAGDLLAGGVAILDEQTAKRLFPHERAVGRTVKFGDLTSNKPWLPVVGVVRDHRLGFNQFPEMGTAHPPAIYAVLAPASGSRWERVGEWIIRVNGDVKAGSAVIAHKMQDIMPAQGILRVEPWNASYQAQLASERYFSLIITMLGVASLALGAAGLFSVISYIAGQRMREYAVRIALGARTEQVVRLVMREGFVMAIGGTGLGAGLGMWAGFLLWDKMWGVYPVDAGALITAEVVLLVVTMLSCLLPALRAARANPLEIIRAA